MNRIKRRKPSRNYSVLPNAMLQDSVLSFRARGLLAFILSLPDDWDIQKTTLYKYAKEGRDATMVAFDELVEHRYVTVEKSRNGNLLCIDYIIDSEPIPVTDFQEAEKPVTEIPVPDNPAPEFPVSENPVLHNTIDQSTIYESTIDQSNQTKRGESAGENEVAEDKTLQTEEGQKGAPGGAATIDIVDQPEPAPVSPRPDPFYRNRNAESVNVPFSVWFAAYDYRAKEEFCKPLWTDLTDQERVQAMSHTPDYLKSEPIKRYRLLPDNYLSSKKFNDEIVPRHEQGVANPVYSGRPNGPTNGAGYPAGHANGHQPTRRKGYLAPGALSRNGQGERNPVEPGVTGTISIDVE